MGGDYPVPGVAAQVDFVNVNYFRITREILGKQ